MSPKISRFRIALAELDDEVWRIVDVPGEMRLSHFHVAIQISMGWQNMHLHEFQTGTGCYLNPRDMDGQEGDAIDERRVTVAELIQDPRNRSFVYRYDFGDCWDHIIKLDSVHDFDGSTFAPSCVAGAGACPPEDCGGSQGYLRCREVFEMRGQRWSRDEAESSLDTETEDLLCWMDGWDPLRFDLPAVNRKLKGRFQNYRSALRANTARVQ